VKVSVRVKTNSKKQKTELNGEGVLVVNLKSSPHEGKANKELVKVLSDYFSVPKTHIDIVSGLKSKNKIVEIN